MRAKKEAPTMEGKKEVTDIISKSDDISNLLMLKHIINELTATRHNLTKREWLALHAGLIDFVINTLYAVCEEVGNDV